jgi:hypothetical protein
MRNITTALVTTLAFASLATFVAAQAPAQQPPSQQPPSVSQPPSTQPPSSQPPARQMPAQADSNLVANGELVKVDTTAKTFTIKAPASAAPSASSTMPTEFSYDATTKVTGAQKTVEGLATMSGNEVTVHYTKQAGKNLATEIEIKEKKS